MIETVEKEEIIREYPNVKEKLNYLEEIVEGHQEHLQFSQNPDARIGHKTTDSSFFGYKMHIAMNEERIITAAVITTGGKSDGKYLQTLVEKSREIGMEIDTVIGGTAYSEKNNIQYAKINYN